MKLPWFTFEANFKMYDLYIVYQTISQKWYATQLQEKILYTFCCAKY